MKKKVLSLLLAGALAMTALTAVEGLLKVQEPIRQHRSLMMAQLHLTAK